jgi:hypothetical protein
VRRTPILPGIIVGAVAASATAGALIAMGRRVGSAALPFSAIGSILGGGQFVRVTPGNVVAGIVAHVVASIGWGLVFAFLVERWRGRTIAAALVVAIAAFCFSLLLGRIAGRGIAIVLTTGDRVILSLVFACALALGMRFAFPARETI